MLSGNDRLKYLFQKHLHDTIDEKEREELFDYFRQAANNEVLKKQIIEVFHLSTPGVESETVDWDKMFFRIVGKEGVKKDKTKKIVLWKRIAAAVLILLIGSTGTYFLLKKNTPETVVAKNQPEQIDVLPGGNKARLTLANGRTILLNNAHKGQLAQQGNVQVLKNGNGLLSYQVHQRTKQRLSRQEMQYNTLTIPRGGQYQLTLSDGTKVWLNAASSIRYPIAFTGKTREVAITGEAYFEVAKNAKKPFIVSHGSVKVKVLGTHFNVNTYANEQNIKVTLLEGLVKVSQLSNGQSRLVHPGEQAQIGAEGKFTVAEKAHAGDVISWKNGFFSFRNDDLQAVMRKLARWYDIDVVYKPGAENDQKFTGKIGRRLTLSQILNGLRLAKAHFEIKANRKVIILP